MVNLRLSQLGHTWILDLDGTLVRHNGYRLDGEDTLLPGAKEFMDKIPEKDMVILLTSRDQSCLEPTVRFLQMNQVRYDHIIFDAPYGERILVNDTKPSGLVTGIAVSTSRDVWGIGEVRIDEML